MKTAYVGFLTDVHSSWKDFCMPPVPPANYKDPAKIHEWLERYTEKQEVEARNKPLTGKIKDFYLFERRDESRVDKGVMGWPDQTALEIISLYDRIFVLNVGIFSVLARMEHLDLRGRISPEYNWIITSRMAHYSLLSDNPQAAPKLFDPIDLLVSSTAEENRNIALVMSRLSLPLKGLESEEVEEDIKDLCINQTARELALIAFDVADRLGV